MAGDVSCLGVAPVPAGRARARFLAVGSFDQTVGFLRFYTGFLLSYDRVLGFSRVASAPAGRARARFLAVGSFNQTAGFILGFRV